MTIRNPFKNGYCMTCLNSYEQVGTSSDVDAHCSVCNGALCSSIISCKKNECEVPDDIQEPDDLPSIGELFALTSTGGFQSYPINNKGETD